MLHRNDSRYEVHRALLWQTLTAVWCTGCPSGSSEVSSCPPIQKCEGSWSVQWGPAAGLEPKALLFTGADCALAEGANDSAQRSLALLEFHLGPGARACKCKRPSAMCCQQRGSIPGNKGRQAACRLAIKTSTKLPASSRLDHW
jgi:hypothetical protein